MKKIFKFFPAALAVMALASCSDVDLDQKAVNTTSAKGDLIVEVEAFDNVSATRAFRDAEGGSLTFKNDDAMNVYDDELYKYDVYKFNNDAFYLEGKKILEAPKYALFPGKDVVRGYFDRTIGKNGKTVAEFRIPQTIVYDASSEQKVGRKVLYAANLPMFGIASFNGDKVYVSNLRHVCGVLKLELNDAFSNATWLRLSSSKKISGTFVAELDASSDDARKAVALKEGKSDLITNDYMYIDLRAIPSRSSVIYIPIIPGINANADGLKLEYSTDATATKGGDITSWTDTGMKFPKEEIKQNKLYTCSNEFALTDMTPNKVNTLLNQYVSSETSIDLTLANKFTIDNSTAGKNILIPALNSGVDVSLSLGKKFGSVATEGWINSSGSALTIEDADDEDPFKGTFTLNISDIHNTMAGTANVTPITIDLPQANVKIVGDYTKMLTGSQLLSIYSAKSVTIGDGTTETKVAPKDIKIGTVNELNIAAKATVKVTTLKENTASGFATPVNAKLNVAGQIDGAVDFSGAYNGKLNLTSSLDDVDAKVISGNVDFGGDVTIALAKEAEAIAGTLTMKGSKSELTMKQGYVNTIVVNTTNTGSWEDPYINVNLDEITGDGLVAFLTLTETKGIAKFSESKWGGKKITNSTYKTKFTTANSTAGCIYTASQLASFASIGGNTTLNNNLNLDDKAWPSYTQKGKFEGVKVVAKDVNEDDRAYPTIKKLNISKGGLFSANTADASVENITIDGVSTKELAAKLENAGAIYASTKTGTNVTINNVAVKGIDLTSGVNAKSEKQQLNKAGGLVGKNEATLKLTSATTEGSIVGYHSLGGLVGDLADGSVTTDAKTKAAVAVSSDFPSGKDMDIDYARIGGLIGTVTGSSATATIDAATTATKPTHKFASLEYTSDEVAGAGYFYTFKPINEEFFGVCGATPKVNALGTGTLKIGKKTYLLPNKGTSDKKGSPAAALADTEWAIYWWQTGRP